jgi:hypothetical protein
MAPPEPRKSLQLGPVGLSHAAHIPGALSRAGSSRWRGPGGLCCKQVLLAAASFNFRERLPNLSQGEAEVFGNLSGLHTRDQRCAHCPALGWMEQRPSGTWGGVVSARMSTRQPSQGYLGLFKGPAQVRGGPR